MGAIKKLSVLISCLLIASVIVHENAQASDISKCTFNKSKRNYLYLLAKPDTKRLFEKTSPRILVIPFVNMDEKLRSLTQEEKESYLVATQIIEKLSKGKSKPLFTFNDTVFSDLTSSEFDSMIAFHHSDTGAIKIPWQLIYFISTICPTHALHHQ